MRPIIPTQERSSLEPDIAALLSSLPRAPQLVQQQFLPYLQQLKKDQPQNAKLSAYLETQSSDRYAPIDSAAHLVHNFA
jgi:hypothetical protein